MLDANCMLSMGLVKLQVSCATKVAVAFSRILTPFAVAALISIIFSWFAPTRIGRLMNPLSSTLVGILTLCVASFVPVLYSTMSGRTDLDVSDATKRAPLYGLGLIGYAIGIAAFLAFSNRLMFVIALAYLCVGLAMCLITLTWKISAHTAGIAGPTTALLFVFGASIAPLYALSVFMVWARVKLRAHTPSEAVAGLIVATVITSIVYLLFYP
jgi:membrane-associated phospholipid phosphatase